jgi:hypothetical protein
MAKRLSRLAVGRLSACTALLSALLTAQVTFSKPNTAHFQGSPMPVSVRHTHRESGDRQFRRLCPSETMADEVLSYNS